MALFKHFRGNRASLAQQPITDGYAYFCIDDGTFHIDFKDKDGVVKRKQINAKDAETINGHSADDFLLEVDIDRILAQAKESGEFDGEDGISVTHTWNGTRVVVTSASGTSSTDLKGEKGDQGVSGVYVGSGDMPEGYNVQIDPSGEAFVPGGENTIPIFDLATMGMEEHLIGEGTITWFFTDTSDILTAMRNGVVGFNIPTNYGPVFVYGLALELAAMEKPQIVSSFVLETIFGDVSITADEEAVWIESSFRQTGTSEERVLELINEALGVIENGTY